MRSDSCICNLLMCKVPADSMHGNDMEYERIMTNLDRGSYCGKRSAGKYSITHILFSQNKKAYIIYTHIQIFPIKRLIYYMYRHTIHDTHTDSPTRLCERLQGLWWYWEYMGSVQVVVGAYRGCHA